LAVADEQVLMHPKGHLEPFYVAALVGGALLFVVGTGLFKKLTNPYRRWPLSHLVGLGLFSLLGGWAIIGHPQPLRLHVAATVLFIIVAFWEWGSFHGGWRERWARWKA
jgi:low temperature requirement protein LtrA